MYVAKRKTLKANYVHKNLFFYFELGLKSNDNTRKRTSFSTSNTVLPLRVSGEITSTSAREL